MFKLESISDVETFWKEFKSLAPDIPQTNTLKNCSNPRVVELPFTYSMFESYNPKKVLECGSSHIDRDYFKIYWELILKRTEPHGIDITELREGRYAKSVPNEEVARFKTQVADIRKTNFPDETFEMIFCISTLEHVGFEVGSKPTPEKPNAIVRLSNFPENPSDHQEDRKGLKELARITKKNGHIVLTLPYVEKCRYLQQTDSMGFIATEIGYDKARTKELVASADLSLEKFHIYFEDENGWNLSNGWDLPKGNKQAVVCLSLRK